VGIGSKWPHTVDGKMKLATALISVVIVFLCCWLYVYREVTVWPDEMPDRFVGKWKLVELHNDENSGIRAIRLSKKAISIFWVPREQDDGEWTTYPIQKISHTTTSSSSAGKYVIFYGEPTSQNLAEFRLQILYGAKQILHVARIGDTGWGEDRYFHDGEFVKD